MRKLRNALFRCFSIVRYAPLRFGFGWSENERKLSRLRNRFQGRRCFVIGNGPSLKKTDLSLLKNEFTIASNGIFLSFESTDFRPTFYTVEDTLVAEDRAPAINQLRGLAKIIPLDLHRWIRRDQDTIYVNFLRGYRNFPRFSDRFAEVVYWGGTVTFMNLQLAYYLGAREIYLIGIDHHYRPPKAKDLQKGDVIQSRTEDENHFHPDYFGPGFRWHDPKVDRMERAYVEAREFFGRTGVRIMNATIGGNLEVFPRVAYEEIFKCPQAT